MKTTIDIADALLTRAKELARAEKRTLRDVVEEGIDRVLSERPKSRRRRVVLPSFSLGGFTPEFKDAPWEKIRDEIYRGHGT